MADVSGSTFGIGKLNNNNYQTWKFKVERLLKRDGTWRAVSTVCLTSGLESIISWNVCNDKALGTICVLVEDAQITYIRDPTTANQAWEALKNYHEKASGINKFTLIVELLQLKYHDENDLEEYVMKAQSLIDNLTSLGNKSAKEFVPWILMHSMPSSYHTLILAQY